MRYLYADSIKQSFRMLGLEHQEKILISYTVEHFMSGSRVNGEQGTSSCTDYSEEIKLLANGPTPFGVYYKSCISNGFCFRTKSSDKNKATQNSGVVVRAVTNSYSSAKDRNPQSGTVNYHGVLFVLATQAEQVWYLEDPLTSDWKVAMSMLRRDHYDVYSVAVEDDLYSQQQLDDPIPVRDEDFPTVKWMKTCMGESDDEE
ncbi:hypothetical protein LIER_18070 [Lithospermum erythrorhizon]|uniref:DUF4216 domain-containing protein n=1 Tax=Lithospermum erythrorhizon TaxID=34254 RepID=A0AAV3QCP4_LITER